MVDANLLGSAAFGVGEVGLRAPEVPAARAEDAVADRRGEVYRVPPGVAKPVGAGAGAAEYREGCVASYAAANRLLPPTGPESASARAAAKAASLAICRSPSRRAESASACARSSSSSSKDAKSTDAAGTGLTPVVTRRPLEVPAVDSVTAGEVVAGVASLVAPSFRAPRVDPEVSFLAPRPLDKGRGAAEVVRDLTGAGGGATVPTPPPGPAAAAPAAEARLPAGAAGAAADVAGAANPVLSGTTGTWRGEGPPAASLRLPTVVGDAGVW